MLIIAAAAFVEVFREGHQTLFGMNVAIKTSIVLSGNNYFIKIVVFGIAVLKTVVFWQFLQARADTHLPCGQKAVIMRV